MTLPVTVIGGYLGAGKTTLVNQMLRQAGGVRIAVLVNEFGELPIDEDLIEAQDDDLISIAGGCICCSFGNDLIAALQQIAALQPSPDHIVIEASGVALPAAIANNVTLIKGMQLGGICVLVDAAAFTRQIRDEYIGDTVERQLQEADIIVLSKSDLVPAQSLRTVQDWLADSWPGKPVITAMQGRVPNEVLLGTIGSAEARQAHPHADRDYDSILLAFDGPCDAATLAEMLSDPALGVIRAKGYVQDTSGRPALVQLAGQRAEHSFPETAGRPGVICIGLKDRLDLQGLRALQTTLTAPVSS